MVEAGAADGATAAAGGRDRLIDAVRAGSLAVVVVWHWVFTVVVWHADGPHASNPIGYTSGLWAATWLLQVMPLFFFCGGYAHIRTWESAQAKGQHWATFIGRRLRTLAGPALVAVAVVGAGAWALSAYLDVGWAVRGAVLVLSPLWFLIVYLLIVTMVPAGAWLRRRFGHNVIVVGIGAVVWVDLLRFHFGHDGIAWLNMLLVWGLVHQAGFDWPAWRALDRRSAWSLVWGGLIGLSALTNMGLYPRSMVGVPGERFSNMGPPTLCIVALAVFQVGVLLVNRERLERFITGPSAGVWVDRLQRSSMTLFLWHVPAYAVVYAVVWATGWRTPEEPTVRWWLERPFWLVVPAALCVAVAGILAVTRRRSAVADDVAV
ncbi:acyltransferase family protein [Actinomarinicola tropica]|uniref:Acyltransferase family protein n=1 Tax=Actinomarinicola tropica TaxID=2789776 RepID=A0A5Q2RR84_9ACTN|nr:acyltransferase [Actinomarinicola tropica]QGG96657.1 acyltransferase family protein [Actinomarinicola tropica]